MPGDRRDFRPDKRFWQIWHRDGPRLVCPSAASCRDWRSLAGCASSAARSRDQPDWCQGEWPLPRPQNCREMQCPARSDCDCEYVPGSVQAAAFAKYEIAITHAKGHHVVGNIESQIRPYVLQPLHPEFYVIKRFQFVWRSPDVRNRCVVNEDFSSSQRADAMTSPRKVGVGIPVGSTQMNHVASILIHSATS